MTDYEFIVATNAGRDVTLQTIGSMIRMYEASHKFKWDILGAGSPARGRNVLCYRFLKGDAPYLIFVDRDILFAPSDIEKILESLKDGYDLIAGTYIVKGTMLLSSGGNDSKEVLHLDGEIQEVRYLATGFMGITRTLLEMMITKLELPLMHVGDSSETYPFFEEIHFEDPILGGMWLSEDYNFCHKARLVGVKSYLDTSIQLGHVGDALWQVDGSIESKQRRTLSPKAQEEITKIIQGDASPVGIK